jgi:hypothetical protein
VSIAGLKYIFRAQCTYPGLNGVFWGQLPFYVAIYPFSEAICLFSGARDGIVWGSI